MAAPTLSTLNVVVGNRTVTPAYPIVSDAFPCAEDLANDKRLEAFMDREVRVGGGNVGEGRFLRGRCASL